MEKEFKVNEFLSLRLEEGKTIIYVKGKRFDQCKFLLLDVSTDQARSFDEIESIDEAAEKLNRSLEAREGSGIIPPETEFWGHCSNLQAWYEHEYNTRLLHRNLAFPLLKRLADCGDSLAKKVFKEEIAKRLESGHQTVVLYLIKEKYLSYFNAEELKAIFSNLLTIMKESMQDSISKRKEFFTLVSAIKGTLKNLENFNDFLTNVFDDFLTNVEAMPDGWSKCKAFSDLLLTIEGTDLMNAFSSRIETIFDDLLTMMESMPDCREKGYALYNLVESIKGTDVMREKFSDLFTVMEIMPDGQYKCDAFYTLVSAIKGTDVMGEKFSDLFTVMETMPDGLYKGRVFSDLVSAITETELMKEKFGDLLTVVETMPDYEGKFFAFSKLVSAIQGTDVMREKCTDLITVVETWPDGRHKRKAVSKLFSAIQGTDLMKSLKNFENLLILVDEEEEILIRGLKSVSGYRRDDIEDGIEEKKNS